ncbi:hypothetical protein BHE74_00058326 [Ensete ventricosum]|nr:hypothetical protein GW17_00007821 [Ensete ventricosum]RWW36644.1 hypothetical protein BHE74_00058326 [Ensete ventricosum]RZR85655.1 hypothetical protein BHM03_00012674 [Ensete ventricosum]
MEKRSYANHEHLEFCRSTSISTQLQDSTNICFSILNTNQVGQINMRFIWETILFRTKHI